MGARRRARELAFRVVFECEASGDRRRETAERVLEDVSPEPETAEYTRRIIDAFDRNAVAVESALRACSLRWKLERMAATDRCVLKVGAVEMMYFADVPAKVIINEAVEIARKFGSEESGDFVNGVLDRLAREKRRRELPDSLP